MHSQESKRTNPCTILRHGFAYREELIQTVRKHTSLQKEEFTDIFYDVNQFIPLILINLWLRKREFKNGKVEWSLKQVSQDGSNSNYREWDKEEAIIRVIRENGLLNSLSLSAINHVVATIPTVRLSANIDGARLILEVADFGKTKSYIGSISVNIDETNGLLPSPCQLVQSSEIACPVRSKVVDFICCHDSLLYKQLLDKQVVHNLRYENIYDPPPVRFKLDTSDGAKRYSEHLIEQAKLREQGEASDDDRFVTNATTIIVFSDDDDDDDCGID